MSENALAVVKATSADIGKMGSGFYFIPSTLARGKELGLPNGFAWYVTGRGGVLGDVEPGVIGSAFGYFNPALIAKMWTAGTAAIAPREASHQYAECARAWGRATFASVRSAATFADLAEKIISNAEPAGLALFAGWQTEPLGDKADPAGRAGMALNVLREHRGSIHLLAVIAAGLSPQEAHFTKGGAARWKTFGYDEAVTPAPRKAPWNRAEKLTDTLTARAYEVLTARQGEQFIKAVAALKKASG